MKISWNASPSRENLVMLEALKEAVRDAFERKRRLGQYAIIFRDGQPVRLEGDDLIIDAPDSAEKP